MLTCVQYVATTARLSMSTRPIFASTRRRCTSRRTTSGTHASRTFETSSHACGRIFFVHTNSETMLNSACHQHIVRRAAATTHTPSQTDANAIATLSCDFALPHLAMRQNHHLRPNYTKARRAQAATNLTETTETDATTMTCTMTRTATMPPTSSMMITTPASSRCRKSPSSSSPSLLMRCERRELNVFKHKPGLRL